MRRDHWILLGVVVFYIVMIPVMRRWQADPRGREEPSTPQETFGLWLLSPLVVVILVGAWLYEHVPPAVFPITQVMRVRRRLHDATKKEQQ